MTHGSDESLSNATSLADYLRRAGPVTGDEFIVRCTDVDESGQRSIYIRRADRDSVTLDFVLTPEGEQRITD